MLFCLLKSSLRETESKSVHTIRAIPARWIVGTRRGALSSQQLLSSFSSFSPSSFHSRSHPSRNESRSPYPLSPSLFPPFGKMAAPAAAPSSGPDLCPSFAVVCGFMERYGQTLDLPEISFPQMERYLRETSTGEAVGRGARESGRKLRHLKPEGEGGPFFFYHHQHHPHPHHPPILLLRQERMCGGCVGRHTLSDICYLTD